MQWKGRRESTNVEDRRGMGGKTLVGGGIGGIIIMLLVTLLGGNGGDLLNNITGSGTDTTSTYAPTQQEQEMRDFVSVVLADTEDVWAEVFKEKGLTYQNPTLVLYTNSVESACGTAGSSVGTVLGTISSILI